MPTPTTSPNPEIERFRFIGEALAGDGQFRPVVADNGWGSVSFSGASAIDRYQRESDEKYARRNRVAFYASPLARAVARFVGFLFSRAPVREFGHPLYQAMTDDINGKADGLEVWWGSFALHYKARGSMLLLVDMPRVTTPAAANLAAQVAKRVAPYWSAILPEQLTKYQVGEDGKFDFAEFAGTWSEGEKQQPCTWHFDRSMWEARDDKDHKIAGDAHPLGECPLLIATEGGEFPHFGPFAAIADLARRLFNMDSEVDEILRGQTFSLLTMQAPDASTELQKLAAAQTVGATIGTQNLMVHTGSTPAFIAPPDGPATIYMARIKDLREQVDEIALTIRESGQAESGEAKRMRFHAVNGELARFAGRCEDLERRAWDLSRRWLSMSQAPTVQWSRDYNLADVTVELQLLKDMRDAGMPREVLVEQQRRIVAVQFAGLSPDEQQLMADAIEAQAQEPESSGNVIPLMPDKNAGLRDAVVKMMQASNGD